jgi:hypothetical protein
MPLGIDEFRKIGERRLIGCWEHTPLILTEGKGCTVKDIGRQRE